MHDVDLELLAPGLLGVLGVDRRDVGDDDVDAAERVAGVRHPGLERRLVGHVERLAVGRHAPRLQRLDRGRDLALVARADRDVRPLVGQDVGAAPADALAAAGDDGAPALEPEIHGPPSSRTTPVRRGWCVGRVRSMRAAGPGRGRG